MHKTVLAILYLLVCLQSHAQYSLALPEVTHYTKQTYKGGAQNRGFAQDKHGVLYVANDEGVLRFDGVRWQLFPLPNKSLVRCIAFGPDGKLYVGGQDEVGYFLPNERGILGFHSLKPQLPAANRSFSDVWKLAFYQGDVFFMTADKLYRTGTKGTKVYTDRQWRFLGLVDGKLMAQNAGPGILVYQNDGFTSWAPGALIPASATITSHTRLNDGTTLLSTFRNGFFRVKGQSFMPWAVKSLLALQAKGISALCQVNQTQIAVGTSGDGCFILDDRGNIVEQFNREQGLQHAGILSIFLDHRQNIWLGLQKGIDFIPYNNAITHLSAGKLKECAGYSSAVYQNSLYLATSMGLFKTHLITKSTTPVTNTYLQPIVGTAGDAWNLSVINNQLFMGHNDGAFLIENNGAKLIDGSKGYWNFVATNGEPNSVVAGTYNGLQYINIVNNVAKPYLPEMVIESARFVVQAYQRTWFSHPYKGIYSIGAHGSRAKYEKAQGVLTQNDNYLFWVRNQLTLTNPSGIYKYDSAQNRFIADAFYGKYLPKYPIRYLRQDAEGNTWFVFGKKIGVLDCSTSEPRIIYFPELTNKFVAGFEHILPLDTANVLMGGEQGFYRIHYSRYRQLQYPLQVMISAVEAIGETDSVVWSMNGSVVNAENHTSELNAFRFQFAAPVYGQLANIEYSYFLDGFDHDWSGYEAKAEKDYTNLPPGNYVFQVKARNNLGNESAPVKYAFTVLPPWYRSWWAYCLYALALGICIFLLVRHQHRKLRTQQRLHSQEQSRLQYLHQLEMDKAEKELVELRNAKLEAELIAKNNELASAALHLVQKSDVLHKIKEQMSRLKDDESPTHHAADLKKILKTLNEENRIDDQWHLFSQHFDGVHNHFLARLRSRFPLLTPNEQKLCAYLKMNLSSKEIAQLMNISPRGVEISRYRLRKKLVVPTGVHLYTFLEALTPESKTDTQN